MDIHPVTSFFRAHWLEVGGVLTLGISLWIAFGPLRHRLPKVLTRLGRYSATLKLLSLSGLCFFTLYHFLTDDIPSAAMNWLVGCLGVMLFGGAIFIFTRKPPQPPHQPPSHSSRPHSGPAGTTR